ncbi:extracellular solute-binding protein [Variovorax sp. PCZ-1]|uniref:extracellular solute-binding protein n=1 Tax=Variovorax sp. PCZ-1 TaxID=2835533 RepID=UPI001BCF0A69|nr:extracellular solute-binding protein [Variovorax sp. PCZ-1]MBS7806956.1 ABC transporter substrate-binding protein [Variovorax sp. PCZ-1]
MIRFGLACLFAAFSLPAAAGHAYSLWGDIKYPSGFTHFDYVNPNAPKGGELVAVSNLRVSTFDKYNPFTIRGTAPAYLDALLFESLLAGAMDEPGTGYGLLAEDVTVAPDGLSAVFKLRTAAKFHNGKPVLALDVKHSFEVLTSKFVRPAYRSLLEDVSGVDVLDERTVRFNFKKKNRELPLTVGGIPIFSRDWGLEKDGKRKPFDQVVMDIPIGSGAYKIGKVNFGKDITYERDTGYWGKDINVNRGSHNFDKITIKIYKDNTARLEGLKAGEFDFMQSHSASEWVRRVNGKRFDQGLLTKREFKHNLPTGFQSYVLNTRKPKLQDVRVREAISLALDFNWLNARLAYHQLERVNGLFGNTDCHAKGLPDEAQLKLLEPWRSKIPPSAFGLMTQPANSGAKEPNPAELRANLKRAVALLKEAGWEVKDGVMRNAKGEPLALEYLDSSEGGLRSHTTLFRNLERIGIQIKPRIVDFALYQNRLQKFDYDFITLAYPGTQNPGQEYVEMFGSKEADTPSGQNYTGMKNPAVDELISKMVSAQSKAELLPVCRALERVIAHSHVLIPQWTSGQHNLAYAGRKLAFKEPMPPYAKADAWLIDTWWAKPASGEGK